MKEDVIAFVNLPKSCMGFTTKSGETFFIHEDDVKNIACQIIIEGSMKNNVVIIKEVDKSIEKANMLYDIIKNEKDMKPDLKNKYLKQIGDLLTSSDKTLINAKTNEEVELKDPK